MDARKEIGDQLGQTLGPEDDGLTLEALGADSLDLAALDTYLGLGLSNDEIAALKTVGDIIAAYEKTQGRKQA